MGILVAHVLVVSCFNNSFLMPKNFMDCLCVILMGFGFTLMGCFSFLIVLPYLFIG